MVHRLGGLILRLSTELTSMPDRVGGQFLHILSERGSIVATVVSKISAASRSVHEVIGQGHHM